MFISERGVVSKPSDSDGFDIDCTDPLGRTALSIAIINENPELIEILLEAGIMTRDALLLAIDEEYVEGVELLLEHEERVWRRDGPHSWEVRKYTEYTCTVHKTGFEGAGPGVCLLHP